MLAINHVCDSCGCETNDTDRLGTTFRCEDCAHAVNLKVAMGEFRLAVCDGASFDRALAEAARDNDVTPAQLRLAFSRGM